MIIFELISTDETFRLNSYNRHGEHLIEIMLPDNKVLEGKDLSKGFRINIMGNIIDCSKFTTRYDIISDTYKQAFFSDDDSTETEDNKIPYVVKRYKPRQPDQEEIEETRALLINNSKASLQRVLEKPFVSYSHSNTKGYYTVTLEKQNLMMARLLTYNMEKQINPNAIIKWNETNKSCEIWTEEEFLKFIMEVKNHVDPIISYQQSLEERIRACKTMEELESIEFEFSKFTINEEVS